MHLAKFEFQIQPLDRIYLPGYKGYPLRGSLGHSLKYAMEAVGKCPSEGRCIEKACAEYNSCPYTQAFVKKGALRPCVVEPPLKKKMEYSSRDVIALNLILFGFGIAYLPYYILAMRIAEQFGIGPGRGRFRLKHVVSANEIERQLVYLSGKDTEARNTYLPIDFNYILDLCPSSVYQVEIRFLTPTHLKADNETARLKGPDFRLPFELLFKRLLSRLWRLSRYYSGDQPGWEWDHTNLLEQAREVRCIEAKLVVEDDNVRSSSRTNELGILPGFTGKVVYEGKALSMLLPYLKLGEYTHVGNQTSFGLGKYIVEVL